MYISKWFYCKCLHVGVCSSTSSVISSQCSQSFVVSLQRTSSQQACIVGLFLFIYCFIQNIASDKKTDVRWMAAPRTLFCPNEMKQARAAQRHGLIQLLHSCCTPRAVEPSRELPWKPALLTLPYSPGEREKLQQRRDLLSLFLLLFLLPPASRAAQHQ